MKRVIKLFNKCWDDIRIVFDRFCNDDYLFVKLDDCFFVKCLKKVFVVN